MYICPVCFSDIETQGHCPVCNYHQESNGSEDLATNVTTYRNNWATELLSRYPNISEFEMEGTTLKKYTGTSQIVVIPTGVRAIKRSAFSRLKRITTLIVPEGVTEIESNTFQINKHLRQVILPDSLTSIGERAFVGCAQLRSIVLPRSLRFIGRHAFNGTAIENVHIHDYVEQIGDGAFRKCKQLKCISVSSGNTHFRTYDNSPGLYTSGNQLLWYPCNCNELSLPPEITEIKADSYYSDIPTTIHIHANIMKISPQAVDGEKMIFIVDPNNRHFSASDKPPALLSKNGCRLIISGAMKSVLTTSTINKVIPKGIEEVCDNASIFIPDTIKEIKFADGLKRIGEKAFVVGDYSTHKSFYFPDSVEYIAHNAFPSEDGWVIESWTKRVDSVSISPYTVIEEDSFGNAQKNLRIIRRESATLTCPICQNPTSTAKCNVCGFEYYTDLDSADKSVRKGKVIQLCRSIRKNALATTTDFTAFEIENDTLIRYSGSERLVAIPEGIRRIGDNAFKDNAYIEAVSLPYGVTTIGESAFCGCKNLSFVSFSDTVETLEKNCFSGTNVRQIHLPLALKKYDNPFSGCDNLKAIHLSPECTSFKMHRGSLYNSDGSELFYCSRLTEDYDSERENSIGTIFTVPETVKIIHACAVQNMAAKELRIGKSVKHITNSSYFAICLGSSDVEKIIVNPKNKYYSTKDGCPALFSKDGTQLLCWPFPSEVHFWEKDDLVDISIPEGVQSVQPFAFYGIPGCVEVIRFPDSLKRIEQCAFNTYRFSSTMCAKELYFSPGLELIEEYAFSDFMDLKKIHISRNTEIQPHAFSPWVDRSFHKY